MTDVRKHSVTISRIECQNHRNKTDGKAAANHKNTMLNVKPDKNPHFQVVDLNYILARMPTLRFLKKFLQGSGSNLERKPALA